VNTPQQSGSQGAEPEFDRVSQHRLANALVGIGIAPTRASIARGAWQHIEPKLIQACWPATNGSAMDMCLRSAATAATKTFSVKLFAHCVSPVRRRTATNNHTVIIVIIMKIMTPIAWRTGRKPGHRYDRPALSC
jgi:hypothetical protein